MFTELARIQEALRQAEDDAAVLKAAPRHADGRFDLDALDDSDQRARFVRALVRTACRNLNSTATSGDVEPPAPWDRGYVSAPTPEWLS